MDSVTLKFVINYIQARSALDSLEALNEKIGFIDDIMAAHYQNVDRVLKQLVNLQDEIKRG